MDSAIHRVPPTGTPACPRHPVQVSDGAGWFALAGASAIAGGLLLGSRWCVLVGGVAAGGVAVWSSVAAPMWTILGWVVLRPLFELGPTYDAGPDLRWSVDALLVAAIARWAWMQRASLQRPLASVLAAVTFAGAACLSALGSGDLGHSLGQTRHLVLAAVLFGVGDQLGRHDADCFRRLALAVVASGVLCAIPAIAQFVGAVPLPPEMIESGLADGDLRPPGPYPLPTVLATHLVIAAALLLVLVPQAWHRRRSSPLAVAGVLVAAAFVWVLLANKSRSPIAGLFAAAGTFTILIWRWRGAIAVACAVVLALATIDTASIRLDEFGPNVNGGATTDSFVWRTEYWGDNLPRLAEQPVTGLGLGRVEQLHVLEQPPHSVYVQTAVEMGAAGLMALFAFIVFLARDLALAARGPNRGPTFRAALISALLCGAYAFIGSFENLITQLSTTGPLALVTGVALGATFGRRASVS